MNNKYIYGSGKYGRLFFENMKEYGIAPAAFVESDVNDTKEKFGVPIISFESLVNIPEDKIVFIAIRDPEISLSLKKRLDQETTNTLVVIISDYIERNLLFRKRSGSDSCNPQAAFCNVCENRVEEFLPSGEQSELFRKHRIIGGGRRENCKCPICGASDRIRWLYYVMKNILKIDTVSGRILHFAPEIPIRNFILNNDSIDYYSCDIKPHLAMHMVDIQEMPFKDHIFDYVISNHVLEHIPDEEKAVSEVIRVLKDDGKWVFSFPICTDAKTYEDASIQSPDDRLREFGQEDHVRLYGNDYKERFEKYGLKIRTYSPCEEFDKDTIRRYGFLEDDTIIIATKTLEAK